MTADATALGDITNSFMLSITAPSAGGSIPGLTGHANTVVFSGNASQYTITTTGNGSSFTVTEGSTVYTLSNVSALQFSDYTDIVASATPPIAGAVSTAQVTELYGAVLGRTPDVAGLSSYQKYAAANPATSFHQFAEWFLASPEYANNTAHAYAQTVAGDQQFVTDSYNNLLHRNPSSTEVAFYENSVIAPALVGLTPGTAAYAAANTQAHAQVLVYFSQSQEFLNNVTVTTQYSTSATHWLVLI